MWSTGKIWWFSVDCNEFGLQLQREQISHLLYEIVDRAQQDGLKLMGADTARDGTFFLFVQNLLQEEGEWGPDHGE